MNNSINRSGSLYCFCELRSEFHEEGNFLKYSLTYTKDDGTTGEYSEMICKQYYKYTTSSKSWLSSVYDNLIVIVSYIIRYVMIKLASFVGFFSITKETKFIMISVFTITFINYGVI